MLSTGVLDTTDFHDSTHTNYGEQLRNGHLSLFFSLSSINGMSPVNIQLNSFLQLLDSIK